MHRVGFITTNVITGRAHANCSPLSNRFILTMCSYLISRIRNSSDLISIQVNIVQGDYARLHEAGKFNITPPHSFYWFGKKSLFNTRNAVCYIIGLKSLFAQNFGNFNNAKWKRFYFCPRWVTVCSMWDWCYRATEVIIHSSIFFFTKEQWTSPGFLHVEDFRPDSNSVSLPKTNICPRAHTILSEW